MASALENTFSFLCGQDPAHSLAFAGEQFPLCQRCAGIYAGAAVATVLLAIFRPRPPPWLLWTYGACLAQIAPMGLDLIPQGPVLRAISGEVFAFGLAGCLGAVPAAHWLRPVSANQVRTGLYLASGAASLPIVPLLGSCGHPACGSSLAALAIGGVATLCVLAGMTAFLLAMSRRRAFEA